MKAILALEDGTIFKGRSFGVEGEVIGEIVFNTGMTGYQEVITDPSYYGQIVTMTYPLIGNYGINLDDMESGRPQIRGMIVREVCRTPSNFRSDERLDDYLKRHNIMGIEGIDTRALTRIIREKGTMKGIITTDENFDFNKKIDEIKSYRIKNPVSEVTTREIKYFKGSGYRIALIDYGIKQNIIRSLLERNCEIYQFPASSPAEDILSINPDGIVLSNGPGDPKDCGREIGVIKSLLGKKPVFGICLGHQLIALAMGADTEKLKYGHRGCNHPVKDLEKDLTYITTQNHGYTVVECSIDTGRAVVTHRNMNDGTIEGIRYKDMPVFSVQFHPEASPGPMETAYLFNKFIDVIRENKS
ncbi:MAG TPA: glutamine-hydrolyzing carbamoyl-phosphate synthase small subunit [Clostridiaceae bacterium]|nr:glutamine-hydrolyzing carbamoyl-phosphate synthase small subunit [Clostridiaceae bacterium]